MANQSLTAQYEALPKIVKILIQIFLGWIVSGIYRVLRYLETKNIVTLVVAIVLIFTGGGFGIVWLIDLITEITSNKISVLAD